jgi:catechol 2,3-dioxygenase-like lactoylglutathione lyase family enzyme
MIHVHELNHVLLHARDLEASVLFYGTILELPRLPRPAFDFPGAWFALGKQELHLVGDPLLEPASRYHHHFALRVDDPFAVRARLEAKGLRGLREPSPRPDGAMQLFLADPDGYIIEFFSSPPRQ